MNQTIPAKAAANSRAGATLPKQSGITAKLHAPSRLRRHRDGWHNSSHKTLFDKTITAYRQASTPCGGKSVHIMAAAAMTKAVKTEAHKIGQNDGRLSDTIIPNKSMIADEERLKLQPHARA